MTLQMADNAPPEEIEVKDGGGDAASDRAAQSIAKGLVLLVAQNKRQGPIRIVGECRQKFDKRIGCGGFWPFDDHRGTVVAGGTGESILY